MGRPAPKLGAYRELIDAWLVADREAPRKQRHTAQRVWRRLVEEHGAQVSERRCASTCIGAGAELGELGEVFVPLCARAGAEAEVDWGEAMVIIAGQPTKVFICS